MGAAVAPFLSLAALVLAALSLGGGLYECLLVDRSWLSHPSLIQPERGGIDRKRFWMPAHAAFELTLIAALWAAWPNDTARAWLLVAAVSHVVMRIWSAFYFIPRALEFERAGDWTPSLSVKAEAWVRLSRWRLPLDFVTLLALWAAVDAVLSRH